MQFTILTTVQLVFTSYSLYSYKIINTQTYVAADFSTLNNFIIAAYNTMSSQGAVTPIDSVNTTATTGHNFLPALLIMLIFGRGPFTAVMF